MGFADFLNHTFASRKARNPRYSLRAFARDLGCDHATLSQWMRGTRPLARASIAALCDALNVPEGLRERCENFDPLDLRVLEAMGGCTPPTTQAVAAKLGAPVDAINISLNRMLRLGMLTMQGTAWRKTQKEMPWQIP